jgi:hypothetical protein
MLRTVKYLSKWLLLFPLSCLAEVLVVLFDMVISRYLIAACVVGAIWGPCHFLFGAGLRSFFWPTLVIGCTLCGLWDGDRIFTIRKYLAKYGIVSPEDS